MVCVLLPLVLVLAPGDQGEPRAELVGAVKQILDQTNLSTSRKLHALLKVVPANASTEEVVLLSEGILGAGLLSPGQEGQVAVMRLLDSFPENPLSYKLLQAIAPIVDDWSLMSRTEGRSWLDLLLRNHSTETAVHRAILLHRAWECVRAGEYDEARRLLESIHEAAREFGNPPVDALVRRLNLLEHEVRLDSCDLETVPVGEVMSLVDQPCPFVLVVFLRAGERDQELRVERANLVREYLVPFGVRTFCVLPSEHPEAITSRPDTASWIFARPTMAAASLAAWCSVTETSGMALLGPSRSLLCVNDHPGFGGMLGQVQRLLQEGERLVQDLAALSSPVDVTTAEPWARFRNAWWTIAEHPPHLIAERHLEMARRAGEESFWALALGIAGRTECAGFDLGPEPADLRWKVAWGWCHLRQGDHATWRRVSDVTYRPSSSECLLFVDAVFDLGLVGTDIREGLQRVVKGANDWRATTMALRALAWNPVAVAMPWRHAVRTNRNWRVRMAWAEGLQGYYDPSSLEELMALLDDDHPRVQEAALTSLQRMTGVPYGYHSKSWSRWWEQNQDSFTFGGRSEAPEEMPQVGSQLTRSVGSSTFYGIQILGSNVVVVIDASDSSYWGVYSATCREVLSMLAGQQESDTFTIIVFGSSLQILSPTMLRTTDQSRASAQKFLERIVPEGLTNAWGALEAAAAFEEADTILLVSDGRPTMGTYTEPQDIVQRWVALNRYHRHRLHAVFMYRGRRFDLSTPLPYPPLDAAEEARRAHLRAAALGEPLDGAPGFVRDLTRVSGGRFAVAFGDDYAAPRSNGPSRD